jgi:hypothetical protein
MPMFPDSGVPYSEAKNSLPDTEVDTAGCPKLWYSTSRCQPRFDPAAANAMLAEDMNLIMRGEVEYDCTNLNHIERAVRYIVQRGLPKGGRLNNGPLDYAMNLDPPLTRYNDYLTLVVNPVQINSGPVRVDIDGNGLVPVVRNDGKPLLAGDLSAGVPKLISYWQGAFYVVGPLGSQFLMQTTVFKIPGSYTWTCPLGVSNADVQVWGAGASGFNCTFGPTAEAPGGNAGMGGCSGGYTRGLRVPVIPGTSYPVMVGAGGGQSYAHSGNSGGPSSFGSSLLTATGGFWGGYWPASNSWETFGKGSGGDINLDGSAGLLCVARTTTMGWNGAYGFGGAAPFGGPGGVPYWPGGWPGGGGGGGGFYGPAASFPSGRGGDGAVFISYYSS